jgi:hypothetical protein
MRKEPTVYDFCYLDDHEDCCDECRERLHLAVSSADHSEQQAQELARAEALAGRNLDEHWYARPDGITTAEWCEAWRLADRRPTLTGPVVLYRGGIGPNSMSWTDSIGQALGFANLRYRTTEVYADLIGPIRLPVWRCEFPPEAVLAYLPGQCEYVIDVERHPPDRAAVYDPTPADFAAYRERFAPILPRSVA